MYKNFVIDTWDDVSEDIKFLEIIEEELTDDEFENESYSLTSEDKEAIKKAFYTYDTKKTGFIQIDHVPNIFRLAGQNPSQKLIEKLIKESNKQGYGVVFLNELIPIFQKYWKLPKQTTAELRNALKVFKIPNEKDMLSISELKKNLTLHGEIFDKADVSIFENFFNTIGTDKISVDAFMRIMVKNYQGEKSLKKKATKVKVLLSVKPKRRGSVAAGRKESIQSNSLPKRRMSVAPANQDKLKNTKKSR